METCRGASKRERERERHEVNACLSIIVGLTQEQSVVSSEFITCFVASMQSSVLPIKGTDAPAHVPVAKHTNTLCGGRQLNKSDLGLLVIALGSPLLASVFQNNGRGGECRGRMRPLTTHCSLRDDAFKVPLESSLFLESRSTAAKPDEVSRGSDWL